MTMTRATDNGATPLRIIDDGTEYVAQMESDGTVYLRVTINKYTLRFSLFNGLDPGQTLLGQCELVDRKI